MANNIQSLGGMAMESLKRLLDYSAASQRVHAKNIANATTEGYSKEVVEFNDELRRAGRISIGGTDPAHLSATAEDELPEFRVNRDASEDGSNNVDTEEELIALAENQLRFNLGARLAAIKLAGLRASIRGRA